MKEYTGKHLMAVCQICNKPISARKANRHMKKYHNVLTSPIGFGR